ncbi:MULTISPECIES: DUF6522 family protein [Rhizobium/Agrobacterium group]|uniref:DUF6522 family protein n=2 Tax=Neorhizobium TaxID=1525371 RepID=A0ABV0M9Y9_9HYPH|nr:MULTISPECIES: DUF6522 family protein [Rhizobium/Agrobacterium group]KGE02246.1 hypothetical protein JL39_01545 [Rhizobium sp. YS-1r]MCC2614161.1 DUF6522 family protein [Neorhizobium petrolearium]WGI71673.1 DUF6522 family protein [Neorhizobium petrolearium]
MHIERGPNGDFILESGELAGRFGLSGEDFRQRIRQGLVKSMVERGEAEDIGTCRLSVRLGNRLWRAILSNEGEVRDEAMTFVRGGGRVRGP